MDGSDRLQAFYLPRCRLDLVNLHLLKINCTGKSCDSLGMADGGTTYNCIGAQDSEAAVTLIFELRVWPPAPSQSFKVRNHTIKTFTKFLVKNTYAPMEVGCDDIRNNRRAWTAFRNSVVQIL